MTEKNSVIPRPVSWPRDLGVRSSEPTRSSPSGGAIGRWNSPQDDRAKAGPAALPPGKYLGLESFLSAIHTVEFSEKKA